MVRLDYSEIEEGFGAVSEKVWSIWQPDTGRSDLQLWETGVSVTINS